LRASSDSAVVPLDAAHVAHWTARDAFGNDVGHGKVSLSSVSGFDLEFDVSQGSALGGAYLSVTVHDGGVRGGASVPFQIQEFRRPEF